MRETLDQVEWVQSRFPRCGGRGIREGEGYGWGFGRTAESRRRGKTSDEKCGIKGPMLLLNSFSPSCVNVLDISKIATPEK